MRFDRGRLDKTLEDFSSLSLEALAKRVGMHEEKLMKLLQRERIQMRYIAGTVWVEGRRPRLPARIDKEEVHR